MLEIQPLQRKGGFLISTNMKKNNLPFEIGEDYENWEFDLEVICKERVPMYDSYMYIGEIKKYLNYLPQKTELIFHLDVLEIVILTSIDLEDNTRQDLNRKLKLSHKISSSQDHLKCSYSEYKSGSLRYCVISQLPNKTIIIYGSSHIIHPVSLNVLDEIQH